MKFAAFGALSVAIGLSGSAYADGLQKAYSAVGSYLQSRGGGLAPFYASCPKVDNDEWQSVASALVVPLSQTDSAVLVNTSMCNGGNGSGQYLAITQRGATRLVLDAGFGDMSFLASNAYFYGDTLTLYGSRWLPNDPHCCPSKKANLEFNLKTGGRKLTILNDSN